MNHDLPLPDEFQLSAYRDRTVAMVRRYGRAAIELGRLPSLLGREFFRAKVTSYTVHTFEDAIIFAFDMERSLEKLTPLERTLLGRLIIQEYTQEDLARRMHMDQSTVQRHFLGAVDRLTEILINHSLLNPTILQPRYQRHPVEIPDAPDATNTSVSQNGAKQPVFSLAPVIDINACQEPANGNFAASA